MLDLNDDRGRAVAARLLDFFGDRTSWQRRLWGVGTVMRLRETVEAVELLDPVPAAQHALNECKASAREALKSDPGVAAAEERGRLAGLLSKPVPAGGAIHEQLREAATRADEGYLARWADALRAGIVGVGPEGIARYVASHLLDSGSSPGHLYRWWTRYALHNEAESHDLADLLELAQEGIVNREQEYQLLVLLGQLPEKQASADAWLTRDEAHAWLAAEGFSARPECAGGLYLTFQSRDAGAAAQRARDLLDIYGSRMAVSGGTGRWEVLPQAWVADAGKPIPMPRSRRVEVPVLAREQQLFARAGDEQVDSGLQLVSLLDEGTPAAAVAGAWAGLESLLKASGDNGAHHVAVRLSQLVACSFCRSELTDLAWHRVRGNKDSISTALKAMETNHERTEQMADLINAHNGGLADPSDRAGEARISKILADPRRELESVRTNAQDALRRLYRQRNMVLHAGRTGAVALPSTLRVAAPLVGAGMDRIAHGWFVDGIRPLRLAAMAELQLARLGTPDAVDVTRLLMPSSKPG